MTQLRYGIFYNPNSGSGKAGQLAQVLEQQLQQEHQKVQQLAGSHPTQLLANAIPQIDTLVIIGGDGTINLAATALILAQASQVQLAVVPAGTVNNFAKRYHLPPDPLAAINLIAGQHQTRKVSLILANQQQAVVSSLTFGNLADLSNEVRQQTKRRFGKLSYVWQAIRHIGKNRSLPIRYQLGDGTDRVLKTWFALITTTKSVGGHVYSQPEPGKMYLSLLHNIHLRQVIPYIFFALTGRLQASKSITQTAVTKARLSSPTHQTVKTRIDGDPGLDLPLELTYLPDCLSLIVPQAD